MSVQVAIRIVCDTPKCEAKIEPPAVTVSAARLFAKQWDWSLDRLLPGEWRRKDFCPRHRTARQREAAARGEA